MSDDERVVGTAAEDGAAAILGVGGAVRTVGGVTAGEGEVLERDVDVAHDVGVEIGDAVVVVGLLDQRGRRAGEVGRAGDGEVGIGGIAEGQLAEGQGQFRLRGE